MKLPENTQSIYFSDLQPWFLVSNQQPTCWIFGYFRQYFDSMCKALPVNTTSVFYV